MNLQSKKIFIIIIVVIVIGITLVFVIKEKSEGYHKIGAILDLTGPISPYGQWSKNGLELALEEINSEQTKIELIIEEIDKTNISTEEAR